MGTLSVLSYTHANVSRDHKSCYNNNNNNMYCRQKGENGNIRNARPRHRHRLDPDTSVVINTTIRLELLLTRDKRLHAQVHEMPFVHVSPENIHTYIHVHNTLQCYVLVPDYNLYSHENPSRKRISTPS